MANQWNFVMYLGFLALLGAGCGQSSSPATTANTNEEVGIIQQTLDDEENAPLFSTDVFIEDQGGASSALGIATESSNNEPQTSTPDPPSLPRWHREITDRHRVVDIHIEDGTAHVEVTTDLSGLLHLDVDGDGTFGTKSIQSTAHRFATFQRVRPRQWRLTELSPLEFSLTDPSKQTIHIEQVTATVNGEVRWTVSDPTTHFPFPSGLPIFSPGEEVVVTAKIKNQGLDGAERTSKVYLHHNGRREPMFDDGTHGDAQAADGIFTTTKLIGQAPGLYHAAVDALDADVFSDETTQNYNATAWAMPYIVARSYTGTMHHLDIEGGCWKFVTDAGQSFEPRGGSADLYQDGLRVTITGFTREDRVTTCQIGPVLRVVNFKIEG